MPDAVDSAPRPDAFRPQQTSRGYEKLSDASRQVLAIAKRKAERLGHDYVGPEHLLLGLLSEPESSAGRALARCGVTLDAIRAVVEAAPPWDAGPMANLADPHLNPSVIEVIKYGWQWAKRYTQYETEPEHLLIGLTQPGVGLVRRFLEAVGVGQPDVNAAAMDAAMQSAAAARPAGAELRVWGAQEEIDRLLALAARLRRPVDVVLWEAVRRMADEGAAHDGSKP